MLVSKKRPANWSTGNIQYIHFAQQHQDITETADAVTKIGLLILAEIKRGELTTQMVVTGTGTETSQTYKHCPNDL